MVVISTTIRDETRALFPSNCIPSEKIAKSFECPDEITELMLFEQVRVRAPADAPARAPWRALRIEIARSR